MNRLATIALLFCFTCLGSGAAEYFHNLQHDAEDAREDAVARAAGQPIQQHHHDESNCPTCAQLHMQLVAGGWVQILICLGLFIAFLTLLDQPLIARLLPVRIDCRGPPIV